jgi:hypothetical protein
MITCKPSIYGKDIMAEACNVHVRKKPEGKRPLGKPRHRWKNNINLNFLKKCDWRMQKDQ